MSKQECNYCQNNPVRGCMECGNETMDSKNMAIESNLYAAEFLLYAFHFDDLDGHNRPKPISAHPLMMLIAEG